METGYWDLGIVGIGGRFGGRDGMAQTLPTLLSFCTANPGNTWIPICAGWFGEINEDFNKTIKVLVSGAASGEDGATMSPLVNTDREGGTLVNMLQQYRRAIGVFIFIARGNAKLKLNRLHYVRATAAEAEDTYKALHSDNRLRPG